MKKDKITFNELLIGALINLKQVDVLDMVILIDKVSYMYEDSKLGFIKRYITVSDGIIYLKQVVDRMTLEDMMNLEQGENVRLLFRELNRELFVLKKIKLLTDERFKKYYYAFGAEELAIINELYQKGMVVLSNTSVGKYDLTKKGEVAYFMDEFEEDIQKFVYELNLRNMNALFLEEYLNTVDLNDRVRYILDRERYSDFINHKKAY